MLGKPTIETLTLEKISCIEAHIFPQNIHSFPQKGMKRNRWGNCFVCKEELNRTKHKPKKRQIAQLGIYAFQTF